MIEGNILEEYLESSLGLNADQASALIWFTLSVLPTWYMVTKKDRPDGIFWLPTTIGLLLEAPTHYAGNLPLTSLTYLFDGAGAAVGTYRSIKGIFKKNNDK